MKSRKFRTELLWLPLVLAALLLIYVPGLGNQLVFDDALLATGTLFAEYRSWVPVRVRMASYGSFVWVNDLLGDGWWKQRLVNLALHFAVVVALWAFYREMLRHIEWPVDEPAGDVERQERDRSLALAVAVGFFALNPVAVYAVGYLIQRSIVMATLFVVLALWLVALAVRLRRPALHGAAFACYVLAVMSKEHALLAPLAAVPVYIIAARPSPRSLSALGAAITILTGAAAAALFYRYGEILGKPFDEYSAVYLSQLANLQPGADRNAYGLSVLNQGYLFFHYGLRWFLPVAEWMSINLRPPFPLSWTAFPQVLGLLGYLVLLAGSCLLVLKRDWRALAGLSILVPVLLFATEFATVWVQDPFVLYRSYLWAIGVPGLAFVMLAGFSARALAATSLVVASLLAWQALDRVLSLATPARAWTDAIRKLPNDASSVGRWFPYLNRGVEYVESRQYNLAMQDFETSSKLGDMGAGVFNRGALFAANGEHVNALQSFDVAERDGYNLYNLPFQRALSLIALGRPHEAYPQLSKAYGMNPPSPTRELVLLHMGRTALQLGRPNDAVSALDGVLHVHPGNGEARFLLAMALVARKDYGRAIAVLDGFRSDKPASKVHYARALAHFGLGQKDLALVEIDAAIRVGPDTPHLQEWRARIAGMR